MNGRSVARPSRAFDVGRSAFHVVLIGGFALESAGRPVPLPRSAQRLIAFLAMRDRVSLRSHVAGTLWPDATDERAMGNLRSTLWRLPKLREPIVVGSGDRLDLADGVTVDVRVLSELARVVIDAPGELDAGRVDELASAGDVLPDWSEDWILIERERFRQLRLHALEGLCRELLRIGRFGRAVEVGLAAIAMEPLRESAHRNLIEVHLAEGNHVEAIRQYESYRRLIHDELGLEPSAQMAGLFSRAPAGAR